MVASVLTRSTYPQAIQAQAPWWRLDISGWGLYTDTFNNYYPPLNGSTPVPKLTSGAMIATIGPDSTVDQVLVGYDDPITHDIEGIAFPGTLGIYRFTIGYNRPSPIIPGPMRFASARSTIYNTTWQADGVGSVTMAPLEAPYLQMFLYQAAPGVVPYQEVRADFLREFSVADTGLSTALPQVIYPVAGRRCVNVYAYCTGTLVADIKVGRLAWYNEDLASPPFAINVGIEKVFATGTANATTHVNFQSSTNNPGQFVTVWGAKNAGAGNLVIIVVASDIPCT